MKYKLRQALLLLAAVGLIAGIVLGITSIPKAVKGLQTLDGTPITSGAQLAQGRPVIIEVQWTINCPYCIKQIEWMKSVRWGSNVSIVLTNVGDSKSKVKRWMEDANLPADWLVLVGGTQSSTGTPYTRIIVFYEGEYKISEEWVGWDRARFRPILKALEDAK